MHVNVNTIAAVILAGGQSRRMEGVSKPFALLGGKSLIEHSISRLRPQLDHILISANEEPPVGARVSYPSGYPILADTIGGFAGPLAGILAAMRWAQKDGTVGQILSVAVDSPFFPNDLLCRFLSSQQSNPSCPVIARTSDGIHPTFGLWPVSLADELEAYLLSGNRKMRFWAEQKYCLYCDYAAISMGEEELDPFFNINRLIDLQRAEGYASTLSALDESR
ncbi:molybdenum cofactor guanylyltransferase MobA [uncultured Cohaesibacter sp.]|uniref:molybdenum cofactor guanylyltransferase MobA n=1 Tax=uncultured Cohaesibacter sp. TaxID=1002546 RepID=UPI0029C68DB2|nr:molybdenum cofactor guanylyltransferase MobA [uncultured Cohaesibacter sp.]